MGADWSFSNLNTRGRCLTDPWLALRVVNFLSERWVAWMRFIDASVEYFIEIARLVSSLPDYNLHRVDAHSTLQCAAATPPTAAHFDGYSGCASLGSCDNVAQMRALPVTLAVALSPAKVATQFGFRAARPTCLRSASEPWRLPLHNSLLSILPGS